MTRASTLIVLVWLGSGCPSATDDRLRTAMDQLARIRQEQDRQSRQLAALRSTTDEQATSLAILRAQLSALERLRAPASAEAPPPAGPALDYSKVLRPAGTDAYAVRRADLDRLLANTTELARGARIVPLAHGGQIVGMRIFGIRPQSVQRALGLENGDAVTEVAGIPFTVNRVQEALERARKVRFIEIKILRRGATRVIKVSVVP